VGRCPWNDATSTLTFDLNQIRLRPLQNDGNGCSPAQVRGNHDGGVIHFAPGGKLVSVR
jgi:hypothetical protein